MRDIVERLRDWEEYDEGKIGDARAEAADLITALRAENERLRAALGKINVGEGWAALIARAALEEKS